MHLPKRVAAALVLFAGFSFATQADTFFIAEEHMAPESFPVVAQTLRDSLGQPDQTVLAPSKRQQVLVSLAELENLVANGDDSRRSERKKESLRKRINHALAEPVVASNRGDVVCSTVRGITSKIPSTQCRERMRSSDDERGSRELLERQAEHINACHNPPCV